MSTTAGSMAVNGAIYPVATLSQLRPPPATGTTYYGRGTAPATIPPAPGVSNNGAALAASSSPFSFVKSPLPVLILMFILGLAGLRYIHWR